MELITIFTFSVDYQMTCWKLVRCLVRTRRNAGLFHNWFGEMERITAPHLSGLV